MATNRPRKSAAAAGGALALILATIFGHEGGFVDHADDPGGATNYGCTEAVVRDAGITTPMSQLTQEQCQGILVERFIDGPGFAPLIEIDPALAHEVIDSGVNAGTRRPSCWLQEGLNAFNYKGRHYPDIQVDCAIGPQTIGAYRALRARRGPLACELMVKYLDGQQAAHYARLTRSDRFESFAVGWFRTRIGNVDVQACYTGEAL